MIDNVGGKKYMAKKMGIEPWANSYVVLKDGTKIFVNEREENIAAQLSKKRFVRITISEPFGKTINVPVSNIKYFGQT